MEPLPTHQTVPSSRGHAPYRRGRLGIVVVMIIGLLGAGLMRAWSMEYQAVAAGPRGLASSRNTLGNMNSYALALLLGGLRGPLVMFLWTTSESQKVDRDLEDLDTKIEWIRLLQPEFDTVHLFQMWNKAYNISVMMASPANKYTAIMEAIDYGNKVDQERPGDLNILHALASTYEGKLAAKNLGESAFYMRQFREESLTDTNRARVFPEESKVFHRLSNMQPLLDESNHLRRDLTAPTRTKPSQPTAYGEWNDGSTLQYLVKYDPFPYGVSPQAMAYNYGKRAQVAMTTEGQKTLQLSSMVIDSQPALLQKMWAEDQAEIADSCVTRAFALKLTPGNVLGNNETLSRIGLNQAVVDQEGMNGALYNYAFASKLAADAIAEFHRHLSDPAYAGRITLYQAHLDDLAGLTELCAADRDYMAAILATINRPGLVQSAQQHYKRAMIIYQRNVLEHYVEDAVFRDQRFPQLYNNRVKVHNVPDDQVNDLYQRANVILQDLKSEQYSDERRDYTRLITRCTIRLAALEAAKPTGGLLQN
jgi:hypothetical protein